MTLFVERVFEVVQNSIKKLNWCDVVDDYAAIGQKCLCNDFRVSGHMFQVIIFTCTIWHFADRVFYKTLYAWIAKLLMLATVIAQFFLIIASRNHYTVDVVVSSYTAPMLWVCFDRYYKDIQLPTNRVGESLEENDSKDGTANDSFDDEECGKAVSQTTPVESVTQLA